MNTKLFPLVLCALLLACGKNPNDSAVDSGLVNSNPERDAGVDAGYPPQFTAVIFDNTRITSISSEPNFQQAEAEIDFGEGTKSAVVLDVELFSTCYPFTKWASNPPPSGQNWPADCDAFDRNFEFILDPPLTPGDPPGIELVRSITPFGGPQRLELDLTDIANARPGKHRIRTTITTWSDGAGQVSGSAGGWNVSAKLYGLPGPAARKVLAVIPLFNGSQTQTGDSDTFNFTLPEGTTTARMEYRATGHGGGPGDGACIGPAEEFCKRSHTIYADGVALETWMPWREDCDDLCSTANFTWPSGRTMTYCLENPCGALSSVRAPRANWCPGSMTPPRIYVPQTWTTPGPHSAKWSINKVAAGGSWRISAHVIVYGN